MEATGTATGVGTAAAIAELDRVAYERVMAVLRKAWETRDPLALADALTWVSVHEQPVPQWLEQAVIQVLLQSRPPIAIRRHRERMAHYRRYQCVENGKAAGLSLEEAYFAAAERLGDVGWEMVKKSHDIVRDDCRDGRAGWYWAGAIPVKR
jgi:hypothetical protein